MPRISAYRWFCFLTIDDVVFDHSTISCFIERVGREAIFHGLNDELFRQCLLSPEMCADSSLVKANVNRHQLSRSGLNVEEFRERAIEEKGLFVLNDSGVDENGMEWEETKYRQDSPRVICRSVRWTPMPAGAPAAPANRRNSITRTTPSWTGVDSSLPGESLMLPKGNVRRCPVCWSAFPCRHPRWPLTPPATLAD